MNRKEIQAKTIFLSGISISFQIFSSIFILFFSIWFHDAVHFATKDE